MQYLIGILAIIIGFINLIVIGVMGKTFGPWNRNIRKKYPNGYKWLSIIAGSLVIVYGILLILGIVPK